MALLNTQEKKFSWGGRALISRFPAHGAVSIVGSVAGGDLRMGSEETAKIHAAMLTEGTASHSKKEIQRMLDSMGASLNFYATPTRLNFSARVRVVHSKDLLSLIAEILKEPIFPEGELTLMKKREEASLALEAQDTRAQAGIYLSRMLYKKGHPNWSETTDESRKELTKLTSKQLRALHEKCVSRGDLIISIAGDMQANKAHILVDRYFSSLPKTKVPKISFAKAPRPRVAKHAKLIEHKAGIDYMLGIATDIDSTHKDYPTLLMGIQVLGKWGGFAGRLMSTVREIEGLTYSIYARLDGFNSKRDGNIWIWANFPPQSFERGRASMMREIKLIVDKGVSDEEARKHCQLYIASSAVQLSSSSAFASTVHNLAVDGRTMSYLDEFNKKVSKLSAKEINKALKKYLIPNKLSESSAGPVGK